MNMAMISCVPRRGGQVVLPIARLTCCVPASSACPPCLPVLPASSARMWPSRAAHGMRAARPLLAFNFLSLIIPLIIIKVMHVVCEAWRGHLLASRGRPGHHRVVYVGEGTELTLCSSCRRTAGRFLCVDTTPRSLWYSSLKHYPVVSKVLQLYTEKTN